MSQPLPQAPRGGRSGRSGVTLVVIFLLVVLMVVLYKYSAMRQSATTPFVSPVQPVPPVESPLPNGPAGLIREMVWIPGGTFMMGDTNNPNEQPVHEVAVDGFWMDRFEMTNKEFERFMKTHRKYRGATSTNDADPVIRVSWDDAGNYCAWRSTQEGMPEGTYRLPTEAEWEFAARGGLAQKQYPWGDFPPDEYSLPVACYKVSSMSNETVLVKLAPVGSNPPNGFGLYDMAGSVWEWCLDWYAEDTYAQRAGSGVARNPHGPASGIKRVWRGGAWLSASSQLRCATREGLGQAQWMDTLGFRCVRIGSVPIDAPRTVPASDVVK